MGCFCYFFCVLEWQLIFSIAFVQQNAKEQLKLSDIGIINKEIVHLIKNEGMFSGIILSV